MAMLTSMFMVMMWVIMLMVVVMLICSFVGDDVNSDCVDGDVGDLLAVMVTVSIKLVMVMVFL